MLNTLEGARRYWYALIPLYRTALNRLDEYKADSEVDRQIRDELAADIAVFTNIHDPDKMVADFEAHLTAAAEAFGGHQGGVALQEHRDTRTKP